MITYTQRLDNAIKKAAWAHQHNKYENKRYRKGTDIPYVIHPFGVMTIASNATNDEDVLIACLMHDVLEDVDSSTYDENQMRQDFGDRVVSIVLDVTKDESKTDWRERSESYLNHLEHKASDEAVIVSTSDKIHNLLSILTDYETYGDAVWDRFTTKSSADQLWWYESILAAVKKRNAPTELQDLLDRQVKELKSRLSKA